MKEQLKAGYVMGNLSALRRTYSNAETVSTSKTYKTLFKPLNLAQKQNEGVLKWKS